jgi:hypothetical protein
VPGCYYQNIWYTGSDAFRKKVGVWSYSFSGGGETTTSDSGGQTCEIAIDWSEEEPTCTEDCSEGELTSGNTSPKKGPRIVTSTSWGYEWDWSEEFSGAFDNGSESVTFSDEVTLASVKAEAEEHFPDFGAWGDGEASASFARFGVASFSATKAQWKIVHPPSPTCYLKVWLQETYTPGYGDPVVTNLTPYVWQATGNPCVPVEEWETPIETGEEDVELPTETGTRTIAILAYSFLPDYDPVADGGPNGFPA